MQTTRLASNGSESSTLIYAFRTFAQYSACILCAMGSLWLSGCTPTTGPDLAIASYGITNTPAGLQSPLPGNINPAPEQRGGISGGATTSLLQQDDVLAAGQAFVPGAFPPSAILPTALASATNLKLPVGAVASSGSYVTDGVEKVIETASASPAPLTPADLAGQVPSPLLPATDQIKQVASLDVGASPDVPAGAIASPIAAEKTARATAAPKTSFFGNLFGKKPERAQQSLTASPAQDAPEIQLASLATSESLATPQTEPMNSLPGVKAKNLFALDPALGDGDEPFDDEPEVQLASASAAGLARLAPNGLLKQTDRVDVACFKPQLVSVLKSIERHYGKKVVVTSGYRSSSGNRRAGGSRNSLHISCAAADIQIDGVGKWQLAKYLRTMPGRGGVGTYCHTDSVHIDVGSERDWNWRCRRR